MPDDLPLILSSGALILSLVTLAIAVRQLRKAGEQLDEARVANELAAKALHEDIQRGTSTHSPACWKHYELSSTRPS